MSSKSLRARLDRRLALSVCALLPAGQAVGLLGVPMAGMSLVAGGIGGVLLARAAANKLFLAPLHAWLKGDAGLADSCDELARVGKRQLQASRRRRRADAERDASRAARARDASRVAGVAEELRRLASSGRRELAVLACELDGGALPAAGAQLFAPREFITNVLPGSLAEADARGMPLGVRVDRRVPRQVRGDPAALRRVLASCLQHVVRSTREGGVELRLALVGMTSARLMLRFEIDGYGGMRQWGDGERTPGGLAGARALLECLGGNLVVEEDGACVGFSVPLARVDAAADESAPAPRAPRVAAQRQLVGAS